MKLETESLRESIFVKRGLEYVLERESEQLEYICNNKHSLIENGLDPDHYKQAVEKNIAELEDLIITATAKVMELTEQKYACFNGH